MLGDVAEITSFDYDSLSQTFLFIDKHERLERFYEIYDELDPSTFWKLFRDCWSMSENLYADQSIISELLDDDYAYDSERLECMSEVERTTLASLPDVLTIYRGCWDGNKDGWSYTLDREKAVWFANRLPVDGKPLLIEAEIKKEHIILYLEERKEAEVIVNPKHITHLQVHKLPEKQPDQEAIRSHLLHSGRFDIE